MKKYQQFFKKQAGKLALLAFFCLLRGNAAAQDGKNSILSDSILQKNMLPDSLPFGEWRTSAVADVQGFEKMHTATLAEALQGKTTGLHVLSSGAPGQLPHVLVRSVHFFNSQQPLYVIDGVLTRDVLHFNPRDVTSVQVLKDAAATALYGSNGANGVIVISTQTKNQVPVFQFDMYRGIQQIPRRLNLMNATQFAALNNLAHDNAGLSRLPAADAAFNPFVNTDWQEEFFRTGQIQNYALRFSQGGKYTRYVVSTDYFRQQGAVVAPEFERYSLRFNSVTQRKRWQLSQSLLLLRAHTTRLIGNPFMEMLRMLPTIPAHDPLNPGGFGYGNPDNFTKGINPVAMQQLQSDAMEMHRVLGQVNADFSIAKDLTYTFGAGLDFQPFFHEKWRRQGRLYYDDTFQGTFYSQNTGAALATQWEHRLRFSKNYRRHQLQLTAAHFEQSQHQRSETKNTRVLNPANPQNTTVSSREKTKAATAMRSFTGLLQYAFANRYLLTTSLRHDRVSQFAPAHRGKFFPAVSAAWVLSEESFLKNHPAISHLKIRTSYGLTGNQDVAPGLYQSPRVEGAPYSFGSEPQPAPTATADRPANPSLRAQTVAMANAGVEAGFYKNQWVVKADYFHAVSRDLLLYTPLPLSLGSETDSAWINAGAMQNRGLEFEINWQPETMPFAITAQVTHLHHRVLSLGNRYGFIETTPGVRTVPGRSAGGFYLLHKEGIFQTEAEAVAGPVQYGIQPQAGDIRYSDVNRDGKVDDADRQFAGSALPSLLYSLIFNSKYRGFDVEVFFHGVHGNKILNLSRRETERMDQNSNYPQHLKPWTPEAPSQTTPRAVVGEQGAVNAKTESDRWLENGAYLRLRNLQIGYTLPQQVAQKLHLQHIRTYLSAHNLLTLTKYTGYSPEIRHTDLFSIGADRGSFPPLRTFSTGLQIGF